MSAILIGRNADTSVSLDPEYGNRHGMIAGATGTGKSVSLMLLAEGFSRLGVPCFLADAKGDLAGLAMAAGEPGAKLKARLDKLKLTDWTRQANPVVFWDLYGKLGHPVRATISEMGPTLLGRVLELSDIQLDVREAITRLGVGEALASTLGEGGVPQPVQQVLVSTPRCRIGTVTEAERATVRQRSPVGEKYDVSVNRESAVEMLAKRAEQKSADAQAVAQRAGADQTPPSRGSAATSASGSPWGGAVHDTLFGNGRRQGMMEAMGKSAMRSVGNQLGRQILRGVLGGIFGGKR